MSCQYKDLLGKPREGRHKYRIPVLDIALFDTLLTVLLALVVSRLFKIPLLPSLVICFLTGIVLHRSFCVKTTIDKTIFG